MKRHALIVAAILAILLPAAILEAATIPSVEMRESNYGGGSCGQTITPPQSIRQANYGPSCAHASTITMLRWQGLPEMAAWWRTSYRGGETFMGLAAKAKHAGLAYAMLRGGDLDILEYATTTRRGAVIDWSGKRHGHHAVFFCGFDGDTAAFIDPNTNRKHTFTREAFLAHWRQCGGRSFTTLYGPPKH